MKPMSAGELAVNAGGRLLYGRSDVIISSFSTNSKEGNKDTLFVPVIGERVDAHDYIKDAYVNGMRAAFTSRNQIPEGVPDMTLIYVENTVLAFQRAAGRYRKQFLAELIGVTGSVGKTTTKEMIGAALEAGLTKDAVLKTIGNMNSQIGLAQMVFKLSGDIKLAVLEMGMSMHGEMTRLSAFAAPNAAVITNIGVAHIGQLGSKESILIEKLNIVNGFKEGGRLFLNCDDPMLYSLCKSLKEGNIPKYLSTASQNSLRHAKIISFGTSAECDYCARDIHTAQDKTYFVCVKKGNENWKEDIVLSVLGVHNVLNALAALAITDTYGILISAAKEGLRNYRPIAMRGEIERVGRFTIIDDTYNASPDSMKSGIDVLCSLEGIRRRVAVFADILELGGVSEVIHREVGDYLAHYKKENGNSVDVLIAIGKEAAYIAEEAKGKKAYLEVFSFQNKTEVIKRLPELMKEGDGILLKGSRGMKLEVLVEELKKMT